MVMYLETALTSKKTSKIALQIFPPSKGTRGIKFMYARNKFIFANLKYSVFLNPKYRIKLHTGPAKNKMIFLACDTVSKCAFIFSPNKVILTFVNLIFSKIAVNKWAASWADSAMIKCICQKFYSVKSNSDEGFIEAPSSQTSM